MLFALERFFTPVFPWEAFVVGTLQSHVSGRLGNNLVKFKGPVRLVAISLLYPVMYSFFEVFYE